MSDRQPTQTKNLDSNNYGLDPLPWSRAREHLIADTPKMETAVFLGTVRPNGTPHAAGIGALWYDGDIYITSSPRAEKARDLANNPACTICFRLKGLDVVLEGTATRVVGRDVLEPVRQGFVKGGWPAEVTEEGDAFTAPFNAPSAGPPPWHVFRVVFHTAFGVAYEEPYGATRWTFD